MPDGGNAEENAYLDVIQSPHILYDSESPEDFDQLDGQDVAQFIRWITHQYYVVHKTVSGDHALFEDRVGEKGYLLYFHNMITATGAENLESLMKAQLSHDVFSESAIDGSAGIATPPPATKRKSKGPPSSSKEKTDEAIFCYILMERDESRTTTSPSTSTSTSRDGHTQVKKKISVRAGEVAMARRISDAVDLNLQKWKDTLKHLREMENDGIPINHPIFIATKATAKMHESSFNASLKLPPIHRQEVYWIFQTQQHLMYRLRVALQWLALQKKMMRTRSDCQVVIAVAAARSNIKFYCFICTYTMLTSTLDCYVHTLQN